MTFNPGELSNWMPFNLSNWMTFNLAEFCNWIIIYRITVNLVDCVYSRMTVLLEHLNLASDARRHASIMPA